MADAKGKILITIDASSKGAQKAINQLASTFEKLPATINKLNTAVDRLAKTVQKVSTAGRSIESFNKKMDTMNRRVTSTGKSVTKAHTEISKMGTASTKIQGTATNLDKAAKGASNLAKNADKAEQQVEELAEAGMQLNKGQSKLLELMKVDPKTAFSAGQEGFLKALSPDYANKFQQGLFKSITGAMGQFAPVQQLVTGLFTKLGGATGVAGQFLSKFGATITGVAMPALLGVVGVLGGATVAAVKFGWNLYSKVVPNMIKAFGTGMQSMIKGTAEALMQINKGYYYVLDAVRLAAQGITNLGRSMFFFLTIPLAGFFGKIGQEVLDFDDTLIRVRKTTGKSAEEMKILQAELQAIARTTATSHSGLARIAEQLGQLGLKSITAISQLTEQFNMLAVATDIAAEDVGITMGRLAAAFEFDLETDLGRRQIINLANVVNKLENEFATSANEVVTATLKYAQAGHVMGIAAHQAAALSAALISMGISEEETGTALRNMSLYVVKNAKDVAKAMSSYEKYNDEAKVMNELNKDAIRVYLDLASAAQEGEGRAQTFLQLMNIGNMRGGRALQAMANNIDLVKRALAVANLEWMTHNSLMNEYNLAMQSTKNQFGLLKNNINDVGITLGESVLPVLNQFMMLLIPAFQELAKFIKSLDDKTKLWIVAIGLAVMVAGPLLMLFGQLVHAVALLGNGFGQLFKILPWILNNIAFIPALLGKVVAGFFGWKGIVAAALVPIGLSFMKMFGVEIPNIMTWLTENMGKWGSTMMQTLAKGLQEGAKLVVAVIQSIANFISSFFESHSPPIAGPLSTIDKWGRNLMRTYLRGFTQADFSILSDIGRRIKTILTQGIDSSENPQMMVNALRKVAQARVSLSNLIDIFNRTGQISRSVLESVTSGLGDMGGDIQKLITLWLQYNKLQRELANIENRRKDVNKNYKDEIKNISKSNMTLEQKVEAMRQTRLGRDSELQGLAEEEDLLESQKDELSERLDWQKQFIDALTEQDELFQEMKDSLKDLAGAGEDAFGGFSGALDDAMEEAKNAFSEATESIRQRITEAQRAWQAFLDGFYGKPLLTPFEEERANIVGETRGAERENAFREEITGKYSVFHKLGSDIGGFVDQINGLWTTLQTTWANITKEFQDFGSNPATQETILKLQAIWGALSDFITGSDSAGEAWEHTKPTAEQQEAWENAAQLYEDVYEALEFIAGIIDDVSTGVEGFVTIFSGLNTGPWNEFLDQLDRFFELLGKILGVELGEGNAFTKIISYVGTLAGLATRAVLGFLNTILETVNALLTIIESFKGGGTSNVLDDFFTIGWNVAKGLAGGLLGAAPDIIENGVTLIRDLLSGMNSEAQIESPSKVTEEMGKMLSEGLGDGLENNLTELIGRAEQWLQDLFDAMDSYMEGIIKNMKDWFEGTYGILTYWGTAQFKNQWGIAGEGMINGLWEGMRKIMTDLKAWLQAEALKLKDIVKTATNQNSPSKDFFLVGENIMTGMLNGMQSVSPEINNYASTLQTPAMAMAIPSYVPTNTNNIPISIEIKDNVFADRGDMDKLASIVSEKVQKELSAKSRRRI